MRRHLIQTLRARRAFTLSELIIVMGLSSVVLLILTALLVSALQTHAKTITRDQAASERRALQSLVIGRIAQADIPLRQAYPQRIEWTLTGDADTPSQMLYLACQVDGTGQVRLARGERPFAASYPPSGPSGSADDSTVVARTDGCDAEDFSIAYADAAGDVIPDPDERRTLTRRVTITYRPVDATKDVVIESAVGLDGAIVDVSEIPNGDFEVADGTVPADWTASAPSSVSLMETSTFEGEHSALLTPASGPVYVSSRLIRAQGDDLVVRVRPSGATPGSCRLQLVDDEGTALYELTPSVPASSWSEVRVPMRGLSGQRIRVRLAAVGGPCAFDGVVAIPDGAAGGLELAPESDPAIQNADNPRVGDVLVIDDGGWPDGTDLTYEWWRCDADGANCAPVSGETGESYQTTSADRDHAIRARVSASKGDEQAQVWTLSTPPVLDLYGAMVRARNPLVYWRFEEAGGTTAEDSSGNGNQGVYTTGTQLGQDGIRGGGSGGAAAFGPSADMLQSTVPAALASADVVGVSLWAKPTGDPAGSGLVKAGLLPTNATPCDTRNGFTIGIEQITTPAAGNNPTGSYDCVDWLYPSSAQVPSGSWGLFSFEAHKGTGGAKPARISFNGGAWATQNVSPGGFRPIVAGEPLLIAEAFTGLVDEVAIYADPDPAWAAQDMACRNSPTVANCPR